MKNHARMLSALLVAAAAVGLAGPAPAAEFSIARIYIEYNSSGNDLGFHVLLDGEDWTSLKIVNPAGRTIFEVEGRGAYRELGMTELFFEGAEPSLDEVPLAELLALMPEGDYRFIGTTVDGARLASTGRLSHAVPRGPDVSAEVDDDEVVIHWTGGTSPPPGFPNRRIEIVGYQVIVGTFQVTLPTSRRKVTLPEEFVRSLGRGEHEFEVLAIDRSGNQTITESSFFIGSNAGDDD